MLVKYGTISVIAIVALMAIFLVDSPTFAAGRSVVFEAAVPVARPVQDCRSGRCERHLSAPAEAMKDPVARMIRPDQQVAASP